jgi:hypothetical protein
MDDTQFHDQMAAEYKKQLHQLDKRPADTTVEAWKNRTLVSAKLDPETFGKLLSYCKDRGYSFNTALRQILCTYFQNHG